MVSVVVVDGDATLVSRCLSRSSSPLFTTDGEQRSA
jgi:hypothetical protein